MRCSRLAAGVLVVVLGLAAGCTPKGPVALVNLPNHELDLSAQPQWAAPPIKRPTKTKPKPAPATKPAMTAEEKKWFVQPGREWRHIVIHHSATDVGNAAAFDAAHRGRGLDELGYHFVINNGHGRPDGRVEVGSRWKKQKWGAHCGGTPNNEYNNHGVGICLVGDFRSRLPSKAQLAAMERLVTFLLREYHMDPDNVVGHCDCPGTATECPGKRLLHYVHATLRPKLARKRAPKK
jgi:N-acetyl-anhydromuramyl-L-alanine amidase AmpD